MGGKFERATMLLHFHVYSHLWHAAFRARLQRDEGYILYGIYGQEEFVRSTGPKNWITLESGDHKVRRCEMVP